MSLGLIYGRTFYYTVTMYSVLAWFAPSGASAGLTLSLSFSLLVRALVEA